jgi:hypothetical protein
MAETVVANRGQPHKLLPGMEGFVADWSSDAQLPGDDVGTRRREVLRRGHRRRGSTAVRYMAGWRSIGEVAGER